VPRPRLDDLVGAVTQRRLTVLTAGAGFGKTTLLSSWADRSHAAWYTLTREDRAATILVRGIVDALRLRVPGLRTDLATALRDAGGPDTEADDLFRARAYATALADDLAVRLKRHLVLILDDVDAVADVPGAVRFIEDLVRQLPPNAHVVLAARAEVPFPIERLRGQGHVLEVTGSDLALTPDETRALVALALPRPDAVLARELDAACGGWPAVTALAIESLRELGRAQRRAAIGRLHDPGGSLFNYLASEVFDSEPPEQQRLLSTAAELGRISAPLAEALGIAGATDTIHRLARRGVYLQADPSAPGWFNVLPLVREFTTAYRPLPDAERREVLAGAASWYAHAGMPEEALRHATDSGDQPLIRRLLLETGTSLLQQGRGELVLAAIERLPARPDPILDGIAAEAYQLNGDWDAALHRYERTAGAGPMRPRLAWRMGLIHHLRGDLDRALAAYSGAAQTDDEPVERAMLLAWWASACWLKGDAAGSLELARQAAEIAQREGDHRSLAAAHTALAMHAAMTGDRVANDGHYLQALEHAERAADVLQMIRIHGNRGSMLIEEGLYTEAITELDTAIELAAMGGYAAFRALGLSNRGEAKHRLGALEEALSDLRAAHELYARMGSSLAAYPLSHMGELYRLRGDVAQATSCLDEAMRLADGAHDVQGIVQTASRMAMVLAASDPAAARPMVQRALAVQESVDRVMALLAAGWVAYRDGDRVTARQRAEEAADMAHHRRDRAGRARALELLALTGSDDAAALLDEALATWRAVGDPVATARAEGLRAVLVGDAGAGSSLEDALARLVALGARGVVTELRGLAGQAGGEPAVAITTLGGFGVLLNGKAVPASAWQSRKARDLLKILVSHRGRPMTREFLMELLWPEEDPSRLSNRLSVALATVRATLDPGKRHGSNHVVVSDGQSVRLELSRVSVDVVRFLDAAAEALQRHEAGDPAASNLLTVAESLYVGDFLEEEPYADWPVVLREEARATYATVARALATDATVRGDFETGVRYFLRLLERDPYDEGAHLGLVSCLVSARRHGDARRRYQAYSARMDELGVESAPFPVPVPA
jgi:DNA-binding SARP family transcriptional activator/Tfp pilus assembly protein PilF